MEPTLILVFRKGLYFFYSETNEPRSRFSALFLWDLFLYCIHIYDYSCDLVSLLCVVCFGDFVLFDMITLIM
jgi:hypothetical protein